jgi:hypothetical protein
LLLRTLNSFLRRLLVLTLLWWNRCVDEINWASIWLSLNEVLICSTYKTISTCILFLLFRLWNLIGCRGFHSKLHLLLFACCLFNFWLLLFLHVNIKLRTIIRRWLLIKITAILVRMTALSALNIIRVFFYCTQLCHLCIQRIFVRHELWVFNLRVTLFKLLLIIKKKSSEIIF